MLFLRPGSGYRSCVMSRWQCFSALLHIPPPPKFFFLSLFHSVLLALQEIIQTFCSGLSIQPLLVPITFACYQSLHSPLQAIQRHVSLRLRAALVFEYKHKYLQGRLTACPFSKTSLRPWAPQPWTLGQVYSARHEFPCVEWASNSTVK